MSEPGIASPLKDLRLQDWAPRSQARPAAHYPQQAAVPAVDVHNHLGRWLHPEGQWIVPDVSELLTTLDDANIETIINLDGRWGDELIANIAHFDRAAPGRIITFGHFDWRALRTENATDALVSQVEDLHASGARGIKIWKDLGLLVADGDGRLVRPDDERLLSALQRAGELGLPILWHVADPVAFFDPLDVRNERVDELLAQPDWWFGAPLYPSHATLLTAFEAAVSACPGTTVIGAHLASLAEDPIAVSRMLDDHPNLVVETGGRMGELGRQPRAVADLIRIHPGRVLFGTDSYPPSVDVYRHWFRFLETADEAFQYYPEAEIPPQGRWDISALDLSATDLTPLYRSARSVLSL